jgi:hypothetical protein
MVDECYVRRREWIREVCLSVRNLFSFLVRLRDMRKNDEYMIFVPVVYCEIEDTLWYSCFNSSCFFSPDRIQQGISVLYATYFVFFSVEVANVLIRLNTAVFYEKLCNFYTRHKFLLKLRRKWRIIKKAGTLHWRHCSVIDDREFKSCFNYHTNIK